MEGPTASPYYFFQREATSPTDTLLWGVGPPGRKTGEKIRRKNSKNFFLFFRDDKKSFSTF